MKKTQCINSELSHVIASMGHQDMLAVADSGLPIPVEVKKIDLALTKGVPGFIETVRIVLSELHIEQVWIADEIKQKNSVIYEQLRELIGDIPVKSLPHEDFKKVIKEQATAVVRTGEFTPYANVILQSGVVF